MRMSRNGTIALAAVAAIIASIILFLMFTSGSTFWVILALLLVVAAGVVGYLRWRRLKALRKALETEETSGEISQDDPRARILKLRMSFSRGLKQFSTFGKGIYSLPWFVVVGEDGAGKTEAIRQSGLGFPPGLENGMLAGGGDRALNWWFTKDAVILEVPGNWVFETEDDDPQSEWAELCRLLAAYRPRTPLNGAILALSAEDLLGDEADATKEKAGRLSRKLAQAQSALEIRFPVFVMVTKSDRIIGFREFFEPVSDSERRQILGWSNSADLTEKYDPKTLKEQLGEVLDRLKARQAELLSVVPVDADTSAPKTAWADSVCAFPGNLAGVIPNLESYLESIFLLGEWSTRPLFLRGIYFTSAQPKGPAMDPEVNRLFGLPVEAPPEEDDEDGDARHPHFIGDLFSKKVVLETGLVLHASGGGGFRKVSKYLPWAFGLACTLLLIFLTLMSVSRLRDEIGDELVYWEAAFREPRWRDVAGRWAWEPVLVRAGERRFEYAGGETIPVGDRDYSVADFLGKVAVRVEKPMELPWTFRFTNRIEGDLSARRLAAARALFESSVLCPAVTASIRKLAVQGADRWSPEATGALTQIVRLQIQARAKQPPDDDGERVDVDALLQYALQDSAGHYERFSGNDSKVLREVLSKLYKGADAPWPPASLDVCGSSARAAVTRGVGNFCAYWADQMGPNRMSRFFADIATLAESGEEFLAAERALAGLARRISTEDGLPKSLARHNKIVGQWERQFARLGVARESIQANQDLLKTGKLQEKYAEIGAKTFAAAEESLKSLKRATEAAVEGGVRDDTGDIAEFFADIDGKLGKQFSLLKKDFDEGKVRDGLARLDSTVFAPVAKVSFEGEQRAYEKRYQIYALAHKALTAPLEVSGLLGLSTALKSARQRIATTKAAVDKQGKLAVPLAAEAAAVSLFACNLSERGRIFLLTKGAFDSAREVQDGIGGMVLRRAVTLDPERKPRIALTVLQGGEFDRRYSRAVALEVLAEKKAIQALLDDPAAATGILELSELRREHQEFDKSLNGYLAGYLGYWVGVATDGLTVRAPTGDLFFKQIGDVKAWQINDGLKNVMGAVEEALTGFKGVGGEVLVERVNATLKKIQTGSQSLEGGQLLEECKKVLGKWSAATRSADDVRETILGTQPGDFFQEYMVSWGSGDADLVLRYWEQLGYQALVRLGDDFQTRAAREYPKLAQLQTFPLARPGITSLNAAQVRDAYALFRRVRIDTSKLAAGSIGKGGQTGKPVIDKALDRLVVAKLPGGLRAWFAGANKVLAAIPDQKSLECEVSLPSAEEQKSLCAKAGKRYETDSAVPIWRAMSLRQGDRWIARPTKTEHPETLPLGKILYPGEALEIELSRFIDDPPDKTVKEPGPWACLRMLHSFGAVRSEDDGRVWHVGVRARDDAGRDRLLWLRLRYPRELPSLADWPSARYAATPAAGGGPDMEPLALTDMKGIPEELVAAVRSGDEAMAARRYAEAAKTYGDIPGAKDIPPVRARLAEARFRLHIQKSFSEEKAGKLQRAIDEVGSAIAIKSTPQAVARRAALQERLSFTKALAAARDLAKAGRLAEARDAYRRALELAPEAERASVRVVLDRLEAKRIEADAGKTLAAIRAMIVKGDLDGALARASWGAGKFAASGRAADFAALRTEATQKIEERNRRAATAGNVAALLKAGADAMAVRQYPQAVKAYEDALKLKDSPDTKARLSEARHLYHMERSRTEEQRGRLRNALEEARAAIAAKSTEAARARRVDLERKLRLEGAVASAKDLDRVGKLAEARTAYERALAEAKGAERPPILKAIERLKAGAGSAGTPVAAKKVPGPLGLEFVLVPGGRYSIGDDAGATAERPRHDVRLAPYYIAVREVTNAQYRQFNRRHAPAKYSQGPERPAANVRWSDAVAFCKWLSRSGGSVYRLPTEAEWEVAARGTDGRRYPWGNEAVDAGGTYRANYAPSKDKNSWGLDGFPYAAPVGSFPAGASPFGCLDMAGNVWEWCHDWYDAGYYAQSPAENPRGPESGKERVLRGGSWYHPISQARSANRMKAPASASQPSIGFRVVMDIPAGKR